MFWRRFFAPDNSLILLYDHLPEALASVFEEQVSEIQSYYKFIPLTQLISAIKKRAPYGYAAVAFQNARKSVFLRGVPFLLERGLPFTVFLRSDCIGMNRLPLEDEDGLRSQGIEKTDPTLFFGTWGEVNQIPPDKLELGMHVTDENSLLAEKTFLKQQMGREVRTAFASKLTEGALSALTSLGIEGVVTTRPGTIQRGTSPLKLPRFEFQYEEKKGE